MRILLAPGGMYPEPGGVPLVDSRTGLAAGDVALALADGWRMRRPGDELTLLPLPDGGPGTAQTVDARRVAARRALQACSPLGQVREVDLLRLREPSGAWTRDKHARTWLLDAARLTALPADAELAARFAPVAEALGAANEAIQTELLAVQGRPVDIGGYYRPEKAETDAVMRPSAALNQIIDAL